VDLAGELAPPPLAFTAAAAAPTPEGPSQREGAPSWRDLPGGSCGSTGAEAAGHETRAWQAKRVVPVTPAACSEGVASLTKCAPSTTWTTHARHTPWPSHARPRGSPARRVAARSVVPGGTSSSRAAPTKTTRITCRA